MSTETTARHVTIEVAANRTGYTKRAIETKIAKGVWIEGFEFRRAPDGRVLVDMEGYERWVVGQRKAA